MKKLIMAAVLISGSTVLFASELETLKSGSEMEAISAETLQQMEIVGIPSPAAENAGQEEYTRKETITAGYLEMEINTMENLYKGYLILENRNIYDGGDENADLLLKLRKKSFTVRGVLMTSLKKKFPFQSVCNVYLKSAPGQNLTSEVFLYSKTFFSEAAAKKYQESIAADTLVKVYFTVHYNYREISESPFKIHAIKPTENHK